MTWQVALDIGGTFTDLVAFNDGTGKLGHAKSSTTPDDLTVGILNCLTKAQIPLDECDAFVHGATIAINTVVERSGARTALVTTAGARDAYFIGRGNRPEAYNVFFKRAEPLLPREMVVEVNERLNALGEVITPLTEAEIAALCERVRLLEPESIAVCLLHSYVNPAHERQIGAALRAAFPNVFVSLSHEILRQYREYERTSTTVVNSYIGPRVSGYLKNLEKQLLERRFNGTLMIMQSNGGVTSVGSAGRVPVALMESGPVGGISASAEFSNTLGFPQLIAFDMGGTTAKASLILDGRPAVAEGYYVGGYASGHPVMLPVVDIVEVGAGGGSIGWLDEVGALKVGPHSAGASPGPVCYQAGGTEPTVTDCNLVLGRIDGKRFMGGEMPLDVAAARAAIQERIARPLNLTVEQAALGILHIAVAHMTLAVRGVSIERGYDPRDFVMVASGGNGGLHAPLIARELGIPKVIIPVLPAHFSALGMLLSDVRHDYVRTFTKPLDDADFNDMRAIFAEFEDEGLGLLRSEAVSEESMQTRYALDLRYVGQEYYLNVPITKADLAASDAAAIRTRFDEVHEKLYAQSGSTERVEIVNVRVSVHGERKRVPIRAEMSANGTTAASARRDVFLSDPKVPVSCAVYQRNDLRPGATISGPAIVEEDATTVLMFDGDTAIVSDHGELIIDIGGAA